MKKIIIYFMIATFGLIYCIQTADKNFKKKSTFDKLKFPILSASIVGLISQHLCENNTKSHNNIGIQDIFTEVPNF